MRGAAGACSRASTASTTMRWRARTLSGSRNGISRRSSRACARPTTFAARSPKRSARKAIMPASSKARPIRWREHEMSAFAAWTRLDRPGRDVALLRPCDGGWVLQGAAAFDHEAGSAAVAYQVEVDARWRTKRGTVSGFLGARTIRHEILRDDTGWSLDGV